MSDTITELQADFALQYVRQNCENATKAYRVIDPEHRYPGKMGMAWLNNPDVAAEIASIVSRSVKERAGVRVLSLGRKRTLLHDFAEDDQLEAKDRMKAVELDGRYAGDFAPEKLDIAASMTLTGLFAEVARGDFALDEYGERVRVVDVTDGAEMMALARLLD